MGAPQEMGHKPQNASRRLTAPYTNCVLPFGSTQFTSSIDSQSLIFYTPYFFASSVALARAGMMCGKMFSEPISLSTPNFSREA